MPKPRGATGATKMKILAIVCHNGECGLNSYGYNIWQTLKTNFHTYLEDDDVRNVYHHLKGLCSMGMLARMEVPNTSAGKYLYTLTEKGLDFRSKYDQYVEILNGA